MIASWVHRLNEVCITMPIVQASISDVSSCMKLIDWRRLLILVRLVSLVIEDHPVSTVDKLEPFSFFVLSGWLKSLSLAHPRLWWLCHPSLDLFLVCIVRTRHISSSITCLSAIFTYNSVHHVKQSLTINRCDLVSLDKTGESGLAVEAPELLAFKSVWHYYNIIIIKNSSQWRWWGC